MVLSYKQEILKDYTLARLGFKKSDFLNLYLDSLHGLAKNYRYLGAKEAVLEYFDYSFDTGEKTEKEVPELIPSNKDYYKQYEFDGKVFVPTTFSILDYLMLEYKAKKEKNFKKVQKANTLISATDLANFTYCPVSYSIGKTFETDIIKSAVIGSKFHAENKLLKWTEPNFKSKRTEEQKINDFSLENEDNKNFFSDIRNSRVIYSGHSDNEKKYFINKKGNFVGQPDYVFQNLKGENFIVEEKFKWKKEESIDSFFYSHRVQLASYLYGLDEFEASYGYLLYWYYSFDTFLQENIIVGCKVLKISRSSQTQYFLRNTFIALSSFIKDKKQDFATEKLNPKKCANCVVNRFCGHKTGRFEDLEVPYSDKYLQLVTVPYPEELKKVSTDMVETSIEISNKNTPKTENLKDLLNSIDWDS